MKMVKSLLLGSAAGLVAVAGAQAADLPVKAKPVQYVKICSLYGAGFYYIPGTDTCLKVGGWVRQYLGYGENGSLTYGGLINNVGTRSTQNFVERTRGYITADARTQTEFGTLRSYIAVGLSAGGSVAPGVNSYDPSSGADGFSANRGFIQIAGFTFGLAQSFYDLYPTPALSYYGANINPSSDTSDGGKLVTAYTAQFGNGLSATISAEGQRSLPVFNATTGNVGVIGPAASSAAPGANGVVSLVSASSQQAMQFPDFVGALRLDQQWGSAQIMGAVHDASATYYGTTTGTGHPSDTLGWAVGGGVKINFPMIGPGDYFSAQVNYAQGATGYANNVGGAYAMFNGNGSYGFGVVTDAVYTTGNGEDLTTAWGVNAAYEHFWNKRWQTSIYGAYVAYEYDSTANAALCAAEAAGGFGGASAALGCTNNFAVWAVGTRTQFNIDSQTYVGLDVIYQGLNSANMNAGVTIAAAGAQPTAVRAVDDQHALQFEFRIHRNFYP